MAESGAINISTLPANWPAPLNIVAFTSYRTGGVSCAPYDSLNLGLHVGDSVAAVLSNREALIDSCSGLSCIQWLDQIHGTVVVEARESGSQAADACYTRQSRLGCAVMTADCLPVLICDQKGEQVAAVHAGWRGLLSGILENTVKTFCMANQHLLVWLGPAISQRHFEVGAEVYEAFIRQASPATRDDTRGAFCISQRRSGHYFADIYQLARIRLAAMGVNQVYGGDYCSYEQAQLFFSYRRDHTTGRMVSLIYKRAI